MLRLCSVHSWDGVVVPKMRAVRRFASTVLLASGAAASGVALNGYFCGGCPSNRDPNALITSIPAPYTTVIFAFMGWDANGNVQNGWDDPTKNFTLTAAAVSALKAQGRRVLVSMGGQDGAIWTDSPPAGFVQTLSTGIVSTLNALNLSGVDFDIENRSGDMVKCGAVLSAVIAAVTSARRGTLVSLAPSMVDLYPALNSISPGFNAQLPPINQSLSLIHMIQIQMYNTWAGVETIAYAQQYVAAVMAGFNATASDGQTFSLAIPPAKLALGYPASTSGASSGFLDPTAVVAMVCGFPAAARTLMTWDIGWDQQANWQFSNAVAAAAC